MSILDRDIHDDRPRKIEWPGQISTSESDPDLCACRNADECCGLCPGTQDEPCCLPKDAEDDE